MRDARQQECEQARPEHIFAQCGNFPVRRQRKKQQPDQADESAQVDNHALNIAPKLPVCAITRFCYASDMRLALWILGSVAVLGLAIYLMLYGMSRGQH